MGPSMNTLKAQLILLSKPNFYNLQQQNPLINQYLSHLSFENCEINFIKSWVSNYTKNAPKFQYGF
jgi:hypothetical protein